MSFDMALADRVRALLPSVSMLEEKPMFGGLAFLGEGRMFAGVVGERLVLWLGRTGVSAALAEHPGTSPMDFTGRVMRSFVYLNPDSVLDDELADWLERAMT